jgi:protein-S-isoprenylcysteine O-methyltransferase Ste14
MSFGICRQSDTEGLTASPLMILCIFGIIGIGIEIDRQWQTAGSFIGAVTIASELCGGGFLTLQLILVFYRKLPIARSPRIAPRFWAIIGANSSYAILLLPRAQPEALRGIASALLICLGTISSILTLSYLGKAFAILPQARLLVTSGPYRLVRHPLYLCETISVLGVSLLYSQPWAIIIAICGFALLFPRMKYEENILSKTFSEYSEYKSATPKILPKRL